jgi:metallophosphoesterase (TIGR00282 family)
MNILAIGDVVSDKGCEFLRARLPSLKKLKNIDFTIVNGENSAVGNGITPASAGHIFDSGADIITTGNHVFRRREIYSFLEENPNIIRPANYHADSPGRGFTVSDLGYSQVAVINLAGRVYMEGCDNPFDAADRILSGIKCKTVIVDFHAEATAEKAALAYYLDGRVSAVFGTHTHVPTSDARILPGGTGFITDLGMTGVGDSVIGVVPSISVQYMRTGMPARFDAADGACVMDGCIFEIDSKTGRCISAEQIIIE